MKLLVFLTTIIVGVRGGRYSLENEYDLRLRNGSSPMEGRVEMYVDDAWGTVCDDGWDMTDATVACWQLGYGKATSAPGSAFFGQGNGTVVVGNVDCEGTENWLHRCKRNDLPSCLHNKDAGAVCSQPDEFDVRLIDGSNSLEGRVEIYLHGRWGTVCGENWDMRDASVVCRQLGFEKATAATGEERFGNGNLPMVVVKFDCNGVESSLQNCPHYDFIFPNSFCSPVDLAGVICSTDRTGQIRLVDGSNKLQGRVEIYINETWGTVCGDSWDINDAMVVCSQLGYGRAVSAYTGGGTEDSVLDGVSCLGQEDRLLECPRNANSCNGYSTAWVICAPLDQYALRLRNGKTHLEGRLEVYQNTTGAWGTVCDDRWDIADATVACKQLGYDKATSAPGSAFFGQGSGYIVFGNVQCKGTEDSLYDCQRGSTTDCIHREDAGVVCSEPGDYAIRLINGSNAMEGRVEVFVNGQWGTVCDHNWDMDDARVVCRQLGFKQATAAPGSAHFGQGSGYVILGNVACNGTESRLRDCPRDMNPICQHDQDAGVVCSNDDPPEEYHLRLRGGAGFPWGRVEVYVNGAWGTVCDHGWDINDAAVVCRQLGYAKAVMAVGSATYGQGTGDIVFDNVACKGTENRLHDCPLDTTNHCHHSEDAGVVCESPVLHDVRLVNGRSAVEGRVEVYQGGSWGTVCDDWWDITDATVACWQLGYNKAISAPGSAYFGQGSGEIAMTQVLCTGSESILNDCLFVPYYSGISDCDHSRDAGLVCGEDESAGDGSVRLVNGTTQYEGRVEVHLNGRWGTVCDKFGWNNDAANVVCQQLGYGNAQPQNFYVKQGSGAIVMNSVSCNGQENRLIDCQHSTNGTCFHGNDAGAKCTTNAPEPLSTAVIVLIVIGSVLVVAILVIVAVISWCHSSRRSRTHQTTGDGMNTTLVQAAYRPHEEVLPSCSSDSQTHPSGVYLTTPNPSDQPSQA